MTVKSKEEMHPFVKYPGGKSKEIPLVLQYLPNRIDRYVEPFVGGGSIFFAMNIKKSYINDKSKDLYNFYSLIQKQDKKLKGYLVKIDNMWHELSKNEIENISISIKELSKDALLSHYASAKAKKSKTISSFNENGKTISDEDIKKIEITARKTAFYMLIRDLYNQKQDSTQLHSACFYFLREYCYSSMFRFSSKGDFNVPYGGMSYNEKYMKCKIDYMFSDKMKEYLAETTIENKDFQDFMNDVALNENDFVFLDPPYDSDFSTYDNNPFDKKEQERLCDCLKKTRAKWMLIIKKTDFIYNLYKDFNVLEYDVNYLVSFKNRNDRATTHLLITNYNIIE